MGERIDLASSYFRAIKINTQAWRNLGMLTFRQITIINPLINRARRDLAKFSRFAPTVNQKAIIRKSDPAIGQYDKKTLTAHPTKSLIVGRERVAFGIETLEQDNNKTLEQALKLAATTVELASLFPSVVQVVLFGAPSEGKS